MANSVAVFPAGYRLTDSSTGAPLSGAKIYFYDAGTTTLKTIYSDADLSTTISNPIITDALGYPTSNGVAKTLIYVGTSSYKVKITNSSEVLIAEHDNVKGAVNVVELGSLSVTSSRPVTSLISTTPYNVEPQNSASTATDQNKILPINCSNSDVTVNLPSAVQVGNGWAVTVQHAGSANQVIISSAAGQTISNGVTSFGTALVLSLSGEEATFVSNGATWRCASYISPNIKRAQGLLTVTARLTAPPGSEVQGDLYIISGSPTGAWSSFAQHDVVQFTNNAWVKFTPPSDSGWVAFVKNENKNYQYQDSAWVDYLNNTVKDHPSVAKFWAQVVVSGTSIASQTNFNCTVSRTNVGRYTVTYTTGFASSSYAVITSISKNAGQRFIYVSSQNSSTCSIEIYDGQSPQSYQDESFYVCGFGTQ